MDLDELRLEIDKVDLEIVRLYEERLLIAEKIAKAKIAINKPIFDEKREQQKIEKVRNLTTLESNKDGIEELFSFLMDKSKERQKTVIDFNKDK